MMPEPKQTTARPKASRNQNNKLGNMTAVNFVERLVWDVPGSVFRHGLAIGDVDNDGDNELVVGTADGDLFIFKGTEIWHKTTGLGLITCVAIGDIFNYGRNALVVICGDGWVHIFYSPRSVNPSTGNLSSGMKNPIEKTAGNLEQFLSNESDQLSGKMECVHLQRIPTNTKIVLVADVDSDGANEMVIGLTDRVVRSYRWSSNADLGTGKLIGLNKWECANQIGAVTLQHTCDGTPTLLVAQPGGTFMRIKCNADDGRSEDDSDTKSEAAASCVDYQTLGISRARNPNISTEILGDLEPGLTELIPVSQSPPKFVPKDTNPKLGLAEDNQLDPKNFKSSSFEFRRNIAQPEIRKRSLDGSSDGKMDFVSGRDTARYQARVNAPETDQVDGNMLGGNVILGEYETRSKKSVLPTYADFSREVHTKIEEKDDERDEELEDVDVIIEKSKPYAIATLDGTIMLVKDEIILWSMQVDRQIFALDRLNVTGNGSDEIVACAWDGQTYILDQARNSVRFQFEEPVRSFCAGNYTLTPGTSTPSLVYNTFSNKIFLYHDVSLPSLMIRSLSPWDHISPRNREFVEDILNNCTEPEKMKKSKRLVDFLLYEMSLEEDDNDNDPENS